MIPLELSALPERLQEKIYPEPNTGCWLWGGYIAVLGYGMICRTDGPIYVHRIVYELLVGPLPEKMLLHHRCETRSCCNPAHLELITYKTHKTKHPIRNQNSLKTHCKYGHPLSGENLYIPPHRPWARYCRQCNVDGARRQRERNR